MPRSLSTLAPVLAALLAMLGISLDAHAAELSFDLVERDNDVILQIRGFDDGVPEPKTVITSKTGALLFLTGHNADAKRLRPKTRHRLDFVQIGQSGERVAVRLAQRKRARGSLRQFVSQTATDNGIDVTIVDRPPEELAPEPVAASPDDEVARAATLAALQEKLDAPKAVPAPLPAPDPLPAANVPTPEDPEAEQGEAEAEAELLAAAASPDDDLADGDASAALAQSGTGSGSRGPIGWAALGLLGIAGAGGWWYKRKKGPAAVNAMEVVSRIGIGPKQQIVWLRAGGRELLLGATEARIEVLTSFGGEASPSEPTVALPGSTTTEPPLAPDGEQRIAAFKARLQQALGKEVRRPAADDDLIPDGIPAHLARLAGDPAWANRQDVA